MLCAVSVARHARAVDPILPGVTGPLSNRRDQVLSTDVARQLRLAVAQLGDEKTGGCYHPMARQIKLRLYARGRLIQNTIIPRTLVIVNIIMTIIIVATSI